MGKGLDLESVFPSYPRQSIDFPQGKLARERDALGAELRGGHHARCVMRVHLG